MPEHRYRATEARVWPFLGRAVEEDEVFTTEDPAVIEGLKGQPYVEDITPKKKASD